MAKATTQELVMYLLERNRPMTINQLAMRTDRHKETVGLALSALTSVGLVYVSGVLGRGKHSVNLYTATKVGKIKPLRAIPRAYSMRTRNAEPMQPFSNNEMDYGDIKPSYILSEVICEANFQSYVPGSNSLPFNFEL